MIEVVVDARTMGSQPSGIGFYLYDFLKGLIHAEKLHIKLITDVAESEQIHYLRAKKFLLSAMEKGYTEAQAFTHILNL